MQFYQELSQKTSYLNTKDKRRLKEAFLFAENAHSGQTRKTGEPYITHPVQVAQSLADLRIDTDCLISALLHDVVEDTHFTLEDIEKNFGYKVATIVSGLSHLEGYKYSSINKQQAANFSKMLITTAKDMRIILIKLADRIDNIKTIDVFRAEKRQRIALETLEIYAPIAAKIGLNSWGLFLEDKSFKALHPNRYQVLSKTIAHIKGDRQALVDETLETIKNELTQNNIHFIDVSGREKQPYSVFKKMTRKKIRFEQLQDLFAFRVVVEDVDSCYLTLGILHRLFRPVPGRFKDYIALPKPNGYQSLHTVLINQKGVQAEMQIRSKEMHYNAEHGIAANWIYKSDSPVKDENLISHEWLNNLLNLYDENADNIDLLEFAKSDLAPKEIFVFTPEGKLITLPAGATALDFAYAIHSKVGNHAVFCEINLQRKELNSRLENGDIINIITKTLSYPTPSWLEFVKTTRARQHIRNYLRHRKNKDSIALGSELLKVALRAEKISLDQLPKYALQTLCEESNVETIDQLLLELGQGSRFSALVVKQIMDIIGKQKKRISTTKNKKQSIEENKDSDALIVGGVESLAIEFARCCGPIYGDYIVGYLSRDKGLVVHRQFCPNIKHVRKTPENLINVKWNAEKKFALHTRLKIEAEKGAGILAQLSSMIAHQGVDIVDIVVAREINFVSVEFEIKIDSRYNLAELIRKLRNTVNIKKVQRAMN